MGDRWYDELSGRWYDLDIGPTIDLRRQQKQMTLAELNQIAHVAYGWHRLSAADRQMLADSGIAAD